MQDFLISLNLHTINQTKQSKSSKNSYITNNIGQNLSQKKEKTKTEIRLLRFFLKLIFILDDFSHNNS